MIATDSIACKVLNDFAANGPAGAPAADRFQITIVLNADNPSAPHTLHFDKSIKPDPHDIDPNTLTPRRGKCPQQSRQKKTRGWWQWRTYLND